jgi:hypothetical protein
MNLLSERLILAFIAVFALQFLREPGDCREIENDVK